MLSHLGFFPNQACLKGFLLFLIRNAFMYPGRAVPPPPAGGSPVTGWWFPHLYHRPGSNRKYSMTKHVLIIQLQRIKSIIQKLGKWEIHPDSVFSNISPTKNVCFIRNRDMIPRPIRSFCLQQFVKHMQESDNSKNDVKQIYYTTKPYF